MGELDQPAAVALGDRAQPRPGDVGDRGQAGLGGVGTGPGGLGPVDAEAGAGAAVLLVEQGDGALRSALVRVLEQTLQRRELADAHLLRELQICKDKLPEDGKACSFCSSTPGSTDVPARCAHQDRDRDADRPGLYTWIRTVANDPSAPAGLLLALHDEVSRSSIAISW